MYTHALQHYTMCPVPFTLSYAIVCVRSCGRCLGPKLPVMSFSPGGFHSPNRQSYQRQREQPVLTKIQALQQILDPGLSKWQACINKTCMNTKTKHSIEDCKRTQVAGVDTTTLAEWDTLSTSPEMLKMRQRNFGEMLVIKGDATLQDLYTRVMELKTDFHHTMKGQELNKTSAMEYAATLVDKIMQPKTKELEALKTELELYKEVALKITGEVLFPADPAKSVHQVPAGTDVDNLELYKAMAASKTSSPNTTPPSMPTPAHKKKRKAITVSVKAVDSSSSQSSTKKPRKASSKKKSKPKREAPVM